MNINKHRLILLLIITTVSASTQAEIFKCKDIDGVVAYTSKPCTKDGEKIKLKTSPPSPMKPNVFLGNKKYKETSVHIGTSYVSSNEAGERAYKKADNEAKKMCKKKGGVLNLKPGSLSMPLFRKGNELKYTAKISVGYVCRN